MKEEKDMTSPDIIFDEIGYWSEIKLDIIREYAAAYSIIINAQSSPSFQHIYIDAFAGAGVHISKTTGEYIPGSPLNAMLIDPPFYEYHLIDLNGEKVNLLRKLTQDDNRVTVYVGDCNKILLEDVYPKVKFEDYRRGLCLLDPYGLHINWKIIESAGQLKTIDMFLNFPVMDMNRNVLWRNPDNVSPKNIARMNAFWGDASWREVAYQPIQTLFGEWDQKRDIEEIVNAFCERLKNIAGFDHVPEPLPMRNSKGAVVYYLFFASQKPVAKKIILKIFNKYRMRGAG